MHEMGTCIKLMQACSKVHIWVNLTEETPADGELKIVESLPDDNTEFLVMLFHRDDIEGHCV